MKKIPFTSLSQDWRTPRAIFEALDKEFKFNDDTCPQNSLIDGLSREWGTCSYVNPPFKTISDWVKKSFEEHQKGKTVVMLIPSRTDTKWFHAYCLKATEIRFCQRRIIYEGAKHNAPFPGCVVIFKS